MKAIRIAFSILALGTLIASCNPCKDINCNHGTCVDERCVCDTHYSGVACDVAANAKLAGSYLLSESCSLGNPGPYQVTVTPNTSTADEAVVVGFWSTPQSSAALKLEQNGLNYNISRQILSTGWEIASTSAQTISEDGKTINFAYNIFSAGNAVSSDNCSGTMVRQ